MAPQLQPWPLYRICLSAASDLVDKGCANIFLEYGSYGNQDCLDAIADIQSQLTSTLPLVVFEHLAEDRNSPETDRRSRTHHYTSVLLWSKDPRIKLGLFLHPSIRRFSVDGRGNELMLMQQQDDFSLGTSIIGGLDEFFWCAHLRRLTNLVQLSLNLITTDDILVLVGSHCHKLEVVNIVSRIKQENVQSYIQQQPQAMFPGITLKFCVSDIGLEALLNCKLMRRITMNRIINQQCSSPSNRKITLEGVRRLVKGLPVLQFISFGSMGKILDTGFDLDKEDHKLRLTHFTERDPTFVRVDRLQRLCPHIAHISLSVPITINSCGNIDANVGPCVPILEALARSDLVLRFIELQHFPYCDAFEELLEAKGHRLQELVFRAVSNLSSSHLIFIGEKCRGLQKLHIKELGPEPISAASTVFQSATSILNRKLFSDLLVLQMNGRGWNPSVILPIMLVGATKIIKLKLLNMTQRASMDNAWHKILSTNKLSNMSSIDFYNGCFVSMPLVRKLTLDSAKLVAFTFIQSESIDLSEVEILRLEVTKKNLNIKLCCSENV
jgi:hypothetical protein